jgi:hypothetical protein
VPGDPSAAEARAGASQTRANADRPTDEKQKRGGRRGWWRLSRNLGRLDGAGWPSASFRFEDGDDESSSRLEAAQMATKEDEDHMRGRGAAIGWLLVGGRCWDGPRVSVWR